MTETCGMCAILPPELMRYDSVGLPVPSAEVKLLDVLLGRSWRPRLLDARMYSTSMGAVGLLMALVVHHAVADARENTRDRLSGCQGLRKDGDRRECVCELTGRDKSYEAL